MTQSMKETGVVQVLIERLEKQRLPRAMEMKERVDGGELLNDSDIRFLTEVFHDATEMGPFLDAQPELQELAARMAHLYKEITDKALENEQQNQH